MIFPIRLFSIHSNYFNLSFLLLTILKELLCLNLLSLNLLYLNLLFLILQIFLMIIHSILLYTQDMFHASFLPSIIINNHHEIHEHKESLYKLILYHIQLNKQYKLQIIQDQSSFLLFLDDDLNFSIESFSYNDQVIIYLCHFLDLSFVIIIIKLPENHFKLYFSIYILLK